MHQKKMKKQQVRLLFCDTNLLPELSFIPNNLLCRVTVPSSQSPMQSCRSFLTISISCAELSFVPHLLPCLLLWSRFLTCWSFIILHQYWIHILWVYNKYLFSSKENTISQWNYGIDIYMHYLSGRFTFKWADKYRMSKYSQHFSFFSHLFWIMLKYYCNNFTRAVAQF